MRRIRIAAVVLLALTWVGGSVGKPHDVGDVTITTLDDTTIDDIDALMFHDFGRQHSKGVFSEDGKSGASKSIIALLEEAEWSGVANGTNGTKNASNTTKPAATKKPAATNKAAAKKTPAKTTNTNTNTTTTSNGQDGRVKSQCTSVTLNKESYTCSAKDITGSSTYEVSSKSPLTLALKPAQANKRLTCTEGEIASGGETAEVAKMNVTCGAGATISCFSFASVGKIKGECGSCQQSLEDDECVAWLPSAVGDTCIGKNSCSIEFKSDTDGAFSVKANDVQAKGDDIKTTAGSAPQNHKFAPDTCGRGHIRLVALCTESSSPSPSPPAQALTY